MRLIILLALLLGPPLFSREPTFHLQDASALITKVYMQGQLTLHGYKKDLMVEVILRDQLIEHPPPLDEPYLQLGPSIGFVPHPGPYRYRGPFNCTPYWLYLASQDPVWIPAILEPSEDYISHAARSPEGGILHPRSKRRGGGHALLIDSLMDVAFRLALLGKFSHDERYFEEAVRQFEIHRNILRDPETGLWSQGRGWINQNPAARSPGTWSRGHGWLIKGMVDTLAILPENSPGFSTLQAMLEDLAYALLEVQLEQGLWPCLLHLPADRSPPETSGSALIAGSIAIAIHQGWLPETPFLPHIHKTFEALPHYVNPNGTVESVSPGPGPLSEWEPWAVTSFPPGDEHGPFAIVYAAMGQKLLD